ncbi:MAG: hypothetical protein OK442_08230 [Thaumarchaeota archaeon]|nr:hypothetical protein [Nitrososphaerota archaeon]
MVTVSTRYEFSQRFNVPAVQAFAWCTDYDSKDHNLMGLRGFRKVTRISDDTVILEDTLYPEGKAVTKKKIVKIDKERMTYFNFHTTGANKNSLYFYRIIPDGESKSRLEYTGYELTYPKKAPSKKQLAATAEADGAARTKEWGLLADAMEKELRGKRS